MTDLLSPLAPAYDVGRHGNLADGIGVSLSEVQPGSIVQAAAWPGQDSALRDAIGMSMGTKLSGEPGHGVVTSTGSAFGFAPRRYLLVSENEGLAESLVTSITEEIGTITDLTHGRTALNVAGPKAEWTLSKLFALDFSQKAFPVGKAVSTNHHEVFAQIHRSGPEQFDLYVFRSFARSFWRTLRHAAEEVGYEIR